MAIWPVVGKKGDKDIDIGLGTELPCTEVGRAALTVYSTGQRWQNDASIQTQGWHILLGP